MTKMLPLILVLVGFLRGADVNAASCSYADVSSAYGSATTGDVLIVPSCGSTAWSGNTLTISKQITVRGQTSCSGTGATLSCIAGTTISNTQPIFIINANGARVTGFTLTGGANGKGLIETTSSASGWRVDHVRLTPSLGGTARGAFAYGFGGGLFDHVYVDTASGGIDVDGADGENGEYAVCETLEANCDGTHSWQTPLTFGSAASVYIEDSYFNFSSVLDGAFDMYGGARYCFRYNHVVGTNSGAHGLDSGGQRSVLQHEVYRNTFTHSGSSIYAIWNSRGGTHRLFENVVTGDWGGFIYLQNYRTSNGYNWGICDGTGSLDQNTSGQHGYACRDQVGRGPSTSEMEWPTGSTFSQILAPGYTWSNTLNGSIMTVTDIVVGDSNGAQSAGSTVVDFIILPNRDFYNEDSENCEAAPSGNCTQGVGVGTLANRPASCTTGVGYWATDQGNWNASGGSQGVLYVCTSSNTWTLQYTPYAYPHPLQDLAGRSRAGGGIRISGGIRTQ